MLFRLPKMAHFKCAFLILFLLSAPTVQAIPFIDSLGRLFKIAHMVNEADELEKLAAVTNKFGILDDEVVGMLGLTQYELQTLKIGSKTVLQADISLLKRLADRLRSQGILSEVNAVALSELNRFAVPKHSVQEALEVIHTKFPGTNLAKKLSDAAKVNSSVVYSLAKALDADKIVLANLSDETIRSKILSKLIESIHSAEINISRIYNPAVEFALYPRSENAVIQRFFGQEYYTGWNYDDTVFSRLIQFGAEKGKLNNVDCLFLSDSQMPFLLNKIINDNPFLIINIHDVSAGKQYSIYRNSIVSGQAPEGALIHLQHELDISFIPLSTDTQLADIEKIAKNGFNAPVVVKHWPQIRAQDLVHNNHTDGLSESLIAKTIETSTVQNTELAVMSQYVQQYSNVPQFNVESKCHANVIRLMNEVNKIPNVNLNKAKVLFLTPKNASYIQSLGMATGPRRWKHHVVLEYDGKILDLNLPPEEQLLSTSQYLKKMFSYENKTVEFLYKKIGLTFQSEHEILNSIQIRSIPALKYKEYSLSRNFDYFLTKKSRFPVTAATDIVNDLDQAALFQNSIAKSTHRLSLDKYGTIDLFTHNSYGRFPLILWSRQKLTFTYDLNIGWMGKSGFGSTRLNNDEIIKFGNRILYEMNTNLHLRTMIESAKLKDKVVIELLH